MTVHPGARRRPVHLDSRKHSAPSKRHRQILFGWKPTRTWFISLIVVIGFVSGCAGGGSSTPPPPPITVSVTSSSTTVLLGNQLQFTAKVTGSSNTTVSWSVNGVSGGNVTVGTIGPTGLYRAPADLPNPASITVTATSQADSTASAKSTVTVTSDVAVTVATNPAFTLSTPTGLTIPVTATITSQGKPDQKVNWSVNGIAGGNSTLGTISITGANSATYQAPQTVPTPYTVTISATSVADGSKSGSAPMIVAGTIASVTQTISAAAGGTITLPDGSSVTIPAGAFASDQSVTLSELSAMPQQPLNRLVVSVGPVLLVTLSVPNPVTAISRPVPTRLQLTSASNIASATPDLSFSINEQAVTNGLTGSAGIVDLIDTQGNPTFAPVTYSPNSTTPFASLSMSSSWLTGIGNAVQSFAVGAVNTVSQPFKNIFQGFNYSLPASRCWDTADPNNPLWADYSSCSSKVSGKNVLVMVHGMLSCVNEMAIPISATALRPIPVIQGLAKYDFVLGFDYDWTQDLADSGKQLTSLLEDLEQKGVQRIDILAHSEGVPVSILGAGGVSDKSRILNFVGLAGPVKGTPVASDDSALLEAILYIVTGGVNVTAGPEGACSAWAITDLKSLINKPFKESLQVTSPRITTDIPQSAKSLATTRIFLAGGTDPKALGIFYLLDIAEGNLPPFAISEPNDGIVGLASALAFDSGFVVHPLPPYTLFHTDLPQDVNVVNDVANQLSHKTAPNLICPSSELPNCEGHQNTVFTFVGSGYNADQSKIEIFSQDSTGTVKPLSQPTLSDGSGTINWTTLPTCSDPTGPFSIFTFDLSEGLASNNVMQKIDPGTCVPPVPRTLTVASTNPGSGVAITVSPADSSSQSNGTTQFVRSYNNGVVVTLIAPATAIGNNFSSWTGCDSVLGTTCRVTMNADRTVAANYALPTTRTLAVASTNPGSGVAITVSPVDNGSQGNGITQFMRSYNDGAVVTLGAPVTASGNNFSNWTGCDIVSGTSCTVTMNASRTLTANYVPPITVTHALTVTSTNPGSGVAIAVSPADNNVQSNGTTQFMRSYNNGVAVTLGAPATAGANNFSSWTGCDGASGTACTVTMNTSRTVTANYSATLPTSLPGFAYVANQNSGDVSAYKVDPASGALTSVGTFTSGLVPASVTADPAGRCLYVANSQDPTTIISVFSINTNTGSLTPGPGVPLSLDEFFPMSIAVHPTGKYVYVANQEGTVSAFTIDPNTCGLTRFSGAAYAAGTLPSSLALDPSGAFLYVTNEGNDNISAYTINSSTGALTPMIGSPFPTGSFPTSITVHPTGKFAFATNGFDNTVSVYKLDQSSGVLTPITGSPFTTGQGPFSVAVEPLGKFVYIPNVGDNNVFAYSFDAAAVAPTPTLIASSPFPTGTTPIFVIADPSGKFLYVANNGSTSVSAFQIDANSGTLTPILPVGFFPAGGGPISMTITALPAH